MPGPGVDTQPDEHPVFGAGWWELQVWGDAVKAFGCVGKWEVIDD